jgi:type II secretory pathway component GspD/PulD (secretin)
VAVLGGLISKNTVNQSKGIPVLGTLPILEYLFSQKTMSVETNELVILLEPVIVEK